MSAQLEPRRFNVTEYYQMARAGVLKPDDRVELIEGEIIQLSPIGSPHAACIRAFTLLLPEKVGKTAVVSVQCPVRLSEFSEPQPDIALLKPRKDLYRKEHPTAEDVLLIIEVADTTVLTDRNIKVPLYARAGIPEAWLVNLPKQLIEVYSDLHNGKYRTCRKFKRSEGVVSDAMPGLTLKVSDILG